MFHPSLSCYSSPAILMSPPCCPAATASCCPVIISLPCSPVLVPQPAVLPSRRRLTSCCDSPDSCSTLARWNSLMGIFLASLKVMCLRRTFDPKVSASMSSVAVPYTFPAFTRAAHCASASHGAWRRRAQTPSLRGLPGLHQSGTLRLRLTRRLEEGAHTPSLRGLPGLHQSGTLRLRLTRRLEEEGTRAVSQMPPRPSPGRHTAPPPHTAPGGGGHTRRHSEASPAFTRAAHCASASHGAWRRGHIRRHSEASPAFTRAAHCASASHGAWRRGHIRRHSEASPAFTRAAHCASASHGAWRRAQTPSLRGLPGLHQSGTLRLRLTRRLEEVAQTPSIRDRVRSLLRSKWKGKVVQFRNQFEWDIPGSKNQWDIPGSKTFRNYFYTRHKVDTRQRMFSIRYLF